MIIDSGDFVVTSTGDILRAEMQTQHFDGAWVEQHVVESFDVDQVAGTLASRITRTPQLLGPGEIIDVIPMPHDP